MNYVLIETMINFKAGRSKETDCLLLYSWNKYYLCQNLSISVYIFILILYIVLSAKRLELYQDDNSEVVTNPFMGATSKYQHSDSSRTPSTPPSRNSLNCLPSNSSILRDKDDDEYEISATASHVAFSSSIVSMPLPHVV